MKAVDRVKAKVKTSTTGSFLANPSGKHQTFLLVAPKNAGKQENTVLKTAVDVIGDRAEAMRWMGTPVRALGYATPVSLLATKEGADAVLAVLSRLEHGVL
jgi:Protein of unknown function (DUF2384)